MTKHDDTTTAQEISIKVTWDGHIVKLINEMMERKIDYMFDGIKIEADGRTLTLQELIQEWMEMDSHTHLLGETISEAFGELEKRFVCADDEYGLEEFVSDIVSGIAPEHPDWTPDDDYLEWRGVFYGDAS